MNSIHWENWDCHIGFLMMKKTEHQCKDWFSSLILQKHHGFEIRYYVLQTFLPSFFFNCVFFFNLFLFLDRSRASSKWCSSHRRCSTCRTARSSIWDGESLSFVTWLSLLYPETYSHCFNLQPPAGAGVPMMPQQPVMYGQPMMRPPFGAAAGPGVQVGVSVRWMFNCYPYR